MKKKKIIVISVILGLIIGFIVFNIIKYRNIYYNKKIYEARVIKVDGNDLSIRCDWNFCSNHGDDKEFIVKKPFYKTHHVGDTIYFLNERGEYIYTYSKEAIKDYILLIVDIIKALFSSAFLYVMFWFMSKSKKVSIIFSTMFFVGIMFSNLASYDDDTLEILGFIFTIGALFIPCIFLKYFKERREQEK